MKLGKIRYRQDPKLATKIEKWKLELLDIVPKLSEEEIVAWRERAR